MDHDGDHFGPAAVIKSSSVHITDLQMLIMSINKRGRPEFQSEREGEIHRETELENVCSATNHGKPNESLDSIPNHNAKVKYPRSHMCMATLHDWH